MKKLEEADIIQAMREEWAAKLQELSETVDAVFKGKVEGEEKMLLSPELKLRHKKSQYLYTVVSVGPRDVVLMTPEGKNFIVSKEELESGYEID